MNRGAHSPQNTDIHTHVSDATQRRYWIFQPRARDFDLPTALGGKKVGDEDEWPVIRNAAEMQPGDGVLFYQMRSSQGVYACGQLVAAPYTQRQLSGPFSGTGAPGEQVVRVRYTKFLPRPFNRVDMTRHAGLSNLHMLRSSDCINCRVTPGEWTALQELVQRACRPRFWWVNQGSSYELARDEGYIWSPQTGTGGRSVQHWTNMRHVRPGDVVLSYAYQAVQAVSRVRNAAVAAPAPDADPDEEAVTGWLVSVEPHELEEPIELEEIPEEWRTAKMEGGPFNYRGGVMQGYLFPVSDTFLQQLVEHFGERLPMWMADIDAGDTQDDAQNSFEALEEQLHADGLYFPSELIANYLLALQTKRFAILTGISGTGKTQLARAVARYHQPSVETEHPVDIPDEAVELEALPYMLKHNRLILPVALLAHLEVPEPRGESTGSTLKVHYRGGEAKLRVSASGSGGGAKALLFKGEFKQWFASTVALGGRFLLRPRIADDGSPSELEVIIPETTVRRESLANYRVVAVRPDWTDNRGLLGYYNPITGTYVATEFLRLLLDARAEEMRAAEQGRQPFPFFAILDEMNLARVEHYFSDFLSALESGEDIELHHNEAVEAGELEDGMPVPRRLRVPQNVFFTGTVNVDETTYMFSPKVLDRAFTIEFNDVDLRGFGTQPNGGDAGLRLTRLPANLVQPARPSTVDWERFSALRGGSLRGVVVELNELLEGATRHFGYRVANEIGRFVWLAAEQGDGSEQSLWDALDLAILQKVLPKFHGTQQELETTLEDLLAFAVLGSGSTTADQRTNAATGWRLRRGELVRKQESGNGDTPKLPRTAAKVWRMLDRVRKQGFTAYVE